MPIENLIFSLLLLLLLAFLLSAALAKAGIIRVDRNQQKQHIFVH